MRTPTGGLRPDAAGTFRATPLSRMCVALPGWHWPVNTCAACYASSICPAMSPPASLTRSAVRRRWVHGSAVQGRGKHPGYVTRRVHPQRMCRRPVSVLRVCGSADCVRWYGKRALGMRFQTRSRSARLAKQRPTSGTRALHSPEIACEEHVAERIYDENETSSVRSGPEDRSCSPAVERHLVAQV